MMNNTLPRAFTLFSIAVTILSQFADGVSSVVYLPLWAVTLLAAAQSTGKSIRLGKQQVFLILIFCLMGGCACLAVLFTGEQGYLTGFFMLVVKSILIYFVGWFLSSHFGTAKNERVILLVYIFASVAYAGWVVVTYVPSLTAWAQSDQYLFAQKNSFGQIAGVAALCSTYIALRGKVPQTSLLYTAIALCLVVAISLAQCRTAILAFCIGTFVLLCLEQRKRLLLLLFGILVLALAVSPTLQAFFAHVLFLDKYSGADLNTFSSGRTGLWATAIGVWLESPFIGIGSYYVDNFYINSLANIGVVGTFFMLTIWVQRIVLNVGYAAEPAISGKLYLVHLTCALTAFYLVESLLEGNPPFGPGSSAFLFWMIGGLLDGHVQSAMTYETDRNHGCSH